MPISFQNDCCRLRVIYKPRFCWSALAAIAFLPLIVGVGAVSVARSEKIDPFLYFVGLVSVIALWDGLQRLFGHTVLEFGELQMSVRHECLGIGMTSRYALADMDEPYWQEGEQRGRRRIPSHMTFKYRGKTKQICSAISGDEVYDIVQQIRERCPEVVERWGQGAHIHSKEVTSLNLS